MSVYDGLVVAILGAGRFHYQFGWRQSSLPNMTLFLSALSSASGSMPETIPTVAYGPL